MQVDALKILSESRLEAMKLQLGKCEKCPLYQDANLVFGVGNVHSPDIMFIGEGPGADEDQFGEPFCGPAGQLLNKMITAMGYRREDVYLDNVVKHRPPNNRKPTKLEGDTCVQHVLEQIDLIEPLTIICVGATAAEHVLKLKGPMISLRNRWYQIKGTPARVIYHPAYLLRLHGDELLQKKKETWDDLQEVRKLVNEIKSGEYSR